MAELVPLSLASVKSRLVLPLVPAHLGVVLDNGPLNGCVCNVQADDSRQTVANDRAADGEHSLLHQETDVVTSWWMD